MWEILSGHDSSNMAAINSSHSAAHSFPFIFLAFATSKNYGDQHSYSCLFIQVLAFGLKVTYEN